MKKSAAMKWVKALRSGKYKQGRGALCVLNDLEEKEFCCLGILCEIATKEGIVSVLPASSKSKNIGIYGSEMGALPREVIDSYGMNSDSGLRGGLKKSLMDLNDESNYSFERIANIIEKEYKVL